MDLSRFKWPIIIIVVAAAIWLVTDPGVNYMYNKFTKGEVGADPKQDELNEAGLSRLAGFLMQTFRYQRAGEVFNECLRRFPQGKNALYNYYRLAKCVEKQGQYAECVKILQDLRDQEAHNTDDRVPTRDVLQLRIDKLVETHELGEIGTM
ncbi:MAG: tetratricopeptide repeat protein [Candidatus Hydrogenedentes bacterium]|nr:tetratricopeptide repeat protein [Candidatus Hydrogenedentota bacterium]